MSYNYQLDATRGPFWRVFIQISGRIGVLIRHFSMDISLNTKSLTRQEALAFLRTHTLDDNLGSWKAILLANAFGVDVAQYYKEDWQGVLPLYYLINILERHYPHALDEEIQGVFANIKPVRYHVVED